jgi:hypothetical protein
VIATGDAFAEGVGVECAGAEAAGEDDAAADDWLATLFDPPPAPHAASTAAIAARQAADLGAET